MCFRSTDRSPPAAPASAFNGGHLKSTLIAAAEARQVPIDTLRLDISGDAVSGPSRFATLRMRVTLDGPATGKEREKLVDIAANGCIVSNTLKQAAEMEITFDEG